MNAQPPLTIFLDDNGVLSDARRRPAQWRRLMGEYFVPRYGGTPEAWAAAHAVVFESYLDRYWRDVGDHPDLDYNVFREQEQRRWLEGLFHCVGLEAPPQEEWLDIVNRSDAWITTRVEAGLPGAAEAVRELHRLGYRLHTASGVESIQLRGYLQAIGIGDLFGRCYGPDLVNRPKQGPSFYARMFADAGVDPSRALVVDDLDLALGWASESGARCVLVGADGADSGGFVSIATLAELPALLQDPSCLPPPAG